MALAGIGLFAHTATLASTATAPRILVMGDSLSAAYDMPTEAGWVALLARRLGNRAEVINAAISGETTAGALARLPDALASHAPDIVIIALGGNDGLRGIALDAFRDNLLRLIETARDAGADVLLAGVRLPSNYGSTFIERFLGVYEEVAATTGVAYVPRLLEDVAGRPERMQADGIHPNQAAQPVILNNIWPALRPLLAARGVMEAGS